MNDAILSAEEVTDLREAYMHTGAPAGMALCDSHEALRRQIADLRAECLAHRDAEIRAEAVLAAMTEELRALCEAVGNFKTAYSGEEGWRIIPDMLADIEDALVHARLAALASAEPDKEGTNDG